MATADEIIAKTAPSRLIDHNLIDKEVEKPVRRHGPLRKAARKPP